MNADDVHAKLVRSLEAAQTEADTTDGLGAAVLESLTAPLALASIALELRALREHFTHPRVIHEATDPADGF